jgi:hypothetical protein
MSEILINAAFTFLAFVMGVGWGIRLQKRKP